MTSRYLESKATLAEKREAITLRAAEEPISPEELAELRARQKRRAGRDELTYTSDPAIWKPEETRKPVQQ